MGLRANLIYETTTSGFFSLNRLHELFLCLCDTRLIWWVVISSSRLRTSEIEIQPLRRFIHRQRTVQRLVHHCEAAPIDVSRQKQFSVALPFIPVHTWNFIRSS